MLRTKAEIEMKVFNSESPEGDADANNLDKESPNGDELI